MAKASTTAGKRQPAAAASKPKPALAQAMVIIHGIGEQRPMDTLRGFARAVWSTDLGLTGPWPGKRTTDPDTGEQINRSWIVPDRRTGSHELRRITTPGMRDTERRTDFYEIYWADLMQETPLRRLLAWFQGLLLRPFSEIPRDARGLYVLAWAALIVGVLPAVALWLADMLGYSVFLPKWAWTIAAAIVSFVVATLLLPYLGDVADYVRAEAGTVGRRAAVRQRGLDLLETLMVDPAYDRIVLVGHSLGSVIAYDLLQILWAEYGPSHRNPRQDKEIAAVLKKIGEYALPLGAGGTPGKPIDGPAALATYRELQWQLYTLLRAPGNQSEKPWKVSDFVTVGSPLTHAEFLIARNESALKRGIEERLFSTCPPVSDKDKEATIIYKERHAHHASVFAATRWTNIYDLGNLWCTGDPISGAMCGNFGPGILDVQVRLASRFLGIRSRLFTHTFYWWQGTPRTVPTGGAEGPPSHIDILREAVDLRRRLEADKPAPKPA